MCVSDQAVKKGILTDLIKLGKEAGLKSFEQVSSSWFLLVFFRYLAISIEQKAGMLAVQASF